VTLFCKSLRKEIFSSASRGSGREGCCTAELFRCGVGNGDELEGVDFGFELSDEPCVERDEALVFEEGFVVDVSEELFAELVPEPKDYKKGGEDFSW
jgi:hypothetical protein